MAIYPDNVSVFTNGWFENDSSVLTDTTSISTFGWFEPTETEEEWNSNSFLPNSYFREETAEYDRESTLYDILVSEAYNLHGVPMVYYTTKYSTSYDRIFGEDANRSLERNFDIQAYYTLPNEEELWTRFGIEGLDNFHIYVSMKHFEAASRYNPSGSRSRAMPTYRPKEGDILKAKYNDYFYEIVTVKSQVGQFLKRQHVWDFIVRPLRQESLNVSAAIEDDGMIENIESIADIFDTSATAQNEMERIKYNPPSPDTDNDVFGGW